MRAAGRTTLSADAKDALAREVVAGPAARAALRDGLLRFGVDAGGSVFRTRRPAIARLLWGLLGDDRKERPIRKLPGTRLHKLATYEIDVAGIVPATSGGRGDRRLELRGAFLACGSLATPARGYHLEFVPPGDGALERLATLLRAEGLVAKRSSRKGRAVAYFKGVDAITQTLAAIGAAHAVFELEDARAYKETKNRIRRLVNTEAANVDRATRAAAAQGAAIAFVAEAIGLANLTPVLREAAELRLAHPTETLAELAARCAPAVRKSTLNGRIAALVRIARGRSVPPDAGSTDAQAGSTGNVRGTA